MKISLLLLVVVLLANTAFAVTPADILIVYNKNVARSREVAEYYAQKRNVPNKNIIGVNVADSEKISFRKFARDLAPPIRKVVLDRQQAGKQSILLLVYGIPLTIGKYPEIDTDQRRRHIRERIDSLEALITELTGQLDRLAATTGHDQEGSYFPEAKTGHQSVLTRARQALQQALAHQNEHSGPAISQKTRQQVLSLFVRLAGMTTILRGIRFDDQNNLAHDNLYKWTSLLEQQLLSARFTGVVDESMDDTASIIRLTQGLLGELAFWHEQKDIDVNDETAAAVDSELGMLLAESYVKARWLLNPYLNQFDALPGIEGIRANTLMVCRLDGPTPQIAKRLVDDALQTEEAGLQGTFYIDARGMKEVKDTTKMGKDKNYYGLYDSHLRRLYDIVREHSAMKVVLDNEEKLFPEKSCPDAALYCGWYSLGKYIDAFTWQKGAVGFHVASSEATTLHRPDSQVR